MAELLRLFTGRSPKPLSKAAIDSFGIQSHPEGLQSPTYLKWLELCKSSSAEGVNSEMLSFLQGNDSIKTLEDLGEPWSRVVARFLDIGDEVTADRADEVIRSAKQPSGADASGWEKPYTAVADTMLALARLKQLGRPGNLDYQSVLKVLSLVSWLDQCKQCPVEVDLVRYLKRPVLMPTSFRNCGNTTVDAGLGGFAFLTQPTAAREETQATLSEEDCVCEEDLRCVEQSACCAKMNLFVIDLMLVKDYTKSYVPGELSFIKNILMGESLGTVNRQLDRTVETIEVDQSVTTSDETYLETNDTSRLQQEIDNTVNDDRKFDAGVTANYTHGKEMAAGKYSVTGTANYSSSQQKEVTDKAVQEHAKNVIERSTKKVETSIRRHTSVTRTTETEETNTHSFDNTGGGANISGQYLYVDKLSRAQVYNYGKKAVAEFYLPEPAALYNYLWITAYGGEPPLAPTASTITADSITTANYQELANQYGLSNVEPPPPSTVTVIQQFKESPGDPKDSLLASDNNPSGFHGSGEYKQTLPIVVPADYAATDMDANIVQLDWNYHQGTSISVSLGGSNVYNSRKDNKAVLHAGLPNLEGAWSADLVAWDVTNYNLILTVTCHLKGSVMKAWQDSIFDGIQKKIAEALTAYKAAYADYLAAKADFEAKELEQRYQRNGRNPSLNRQIEATELKRMAISYLTCQFFDQFDSMKGRVKPCGHPQFSICEAEDEGRFIQFIEQAFDWTLLTYLFYPYFWSRKCTWQDKMRDESGDYIFNKFLTAGSARVLVPLRDGYFDYVQYFLEYGEIWGGNDTPPVPKDPHYVSMAQEMKEQRFNYYTDREGTLDVVAGSKVVTLNHSHEYRGFSAASSAHHIEADIDREINIDARIYRIVSIVENTAVPGHTSWTITLERDYEGATATALKWSTGAVYVGAPWEYTTPTNLVFLRQPSNCLPSYPLPDCKE